MSRLPTRGWKTARGALELGLLGMCLAGARPALAGCVPFAPDKDPTKLQLPGCGAANLDSTFAQAIGLAPSSDPSAMNTQTVDPITALSHFSSPQDIPQPPPIFDIAPPDPFVLSAMGKPKEPVKSIPNLPALWSGMTGLGGLGTLACLRRFKRAIR